MKKWLIKELPIDENLESRAILKALPKAHAALAELKGIAETIPDQSILINTLSIQEAKDSSEIENIITTHDQLYKSDIFSNSDVSPASKEVLRYVSAIKTGFQLVQKNNFIDTKTIVKIQTELEMNSAGIRKLPGTVLRNAVTSQVIYEPPQNSLEIIRLMTNLEKYINDNELDDYDIITKMAIIHFQFESIHPFYDGNGRTGRILNILYLIMNELQTLPILYLSRYITQNKSSYYKLIQDVRDNNNWEEWILFIIKAVTETAISTTILIKEIKVLMSEHKSVLKSNYKFYSHELLNNLYRHPYTKVEFIIEELGVSKNTALSYLNKLANDGVLTKTKLGYSNFYINTNLYNLLEKR